MNKEINWWGVCFWIFVIVFLIFICIQSVSAAWMIPKYKTCEFMNVTGKDCDNLWCSVIDCEYNITREACVCNDEFYSVGINTDEFYNKSQIDEKINALNSTTISRINSIDISNYTDSQIVALRDSLISRIDNETMGIWNSAKASTNSSKGAEPNYYFLGFVVLVVAGIIAFMVYNKKFDTGVKKETSAQYKRQFSNPTSFKKIEENPKIEEKQETKEQEQPFGEED